MASVDNSLPTKDEEDFFTAAVLFLSIVYLIYKFFEVRLFILGHGKFLQVE